MQFVNYATAHFTQLPAAVFSDTNSSYDTVGGSSVANKHAVCYGVIQEVIFNFG